MATLTQCLTAALLPRYSGGVGVAAGHAAMARVVLSVLVGAARSGAIPPFRPGGVRGRGVVAALLATPPMAWPEEAAQAEAYTSDRVAPSPPLSLHEEKRFGSVWKNKLYMNGFLQKLNQSPTVPEALRPTPLRPAAPDGAVQSVAAHSGVALPGTDLTGVARQGTGVWSRTARDAPPEQRLPRSSSPLLHVHLRPYARGGGTMRHTAPGHGHDGYGQQAYVHGGYGVAMLLGHMGATQAQKSVASGAAGRMHGVYGRVIALPHHAGFMADVLHHAGMFAEGGQGEEAQEALSHVPDYLHATSRAVGVASMALPSATPAPAIQAQVTVNATNSTPQAIGDEVARRMDMLRMQARQANMGQF
ncbi:hypothetical protein PY793_07800 [Acetobacter fabarum]|uniref:hypothetical protein n=1 Tax=Acetobacter fabarum TaxID=483199 RepID=UPI00312B3F31